MVEGDGDVTAAPLLARRVLHENSIYDWDFPRPHKRRDIAHLCGGNWNNFKRYLAAAFYEELPIFWLLDCDDTCALVQLQKFYEQIQPSDVRQPLAFGFWVKEYECLFLADLDTTGNKLGITKFRDVPDDLESKRGIKEWLSAQMARGRSYKETIDQEKLTSSVNLNNLRQRSRSFRHFEKALLWLVRQETATLYPSDFR
ncbi:MAG: DUF4276 family protein [Gammaproteobacteria bacterium]